MLVDRATARVTVMASTEGGMEIEEVAANTPEKILKVAIDPATGLHAASRRGAVAFGLGLEGEPGRARRSSSSTALLPGLHRARRQPGRDQSAGRDRGGRGAGARRQDELRRQRPVPPQGRRGAARRGRGGPGRARGRQARPQLHQARRQHRLHGQRRRPGHGDDGHHQALRRRAGQLPRRRRRRHQGAGDRRLQDHPLRPERRRASWSTSSAASCAAT